MLPINILKTTNVQEIDDVFLEEKKRIRYRLFLMMARAISGLRKARRQDEKYPIRKRT